MEKRFRVDFEIYSIELNNQIRLVYELIKLNNKLRLVYKLEKDKDSLIRITNADNHMRGNFRYKLFSELEDIKVARAILDKAYNGEWISGEEIKTFGECITRISKSF